MIRFSTSLLTLAVLFPAVGRGAPAQDPALPGDPGYVTCGVGSVGRTAESGTSSIQPPGPRTVLALVVDFSDLTVETSYGIPDAVQLVADVMYDDPLNVAGVIAEASFGLHTLVPDADLDGQHDIVRVTIPSTILDAQFCDVHLWAAQADSQAVSAGVDLALYQHIAYLLPRVAGLCPWSGLGDVGGLRSYMLSTNATVFAHEIGHNLGMDHASTDPDNDGVVNGPYSDFSDLMGASSTWKAFNGPHKVQMGWLPPSQVVDLFGGGVWTFSLDAIEIDPALTIHPQILRIDKPTDPDRSYYLSYRAMIGYDAGLDPIYLDNLQLHTARPDGAPTYHVTGIPDGQSFSDPAAFNLQITVLSHDAATVTFEVQRDDPDRDADGFGESVDCDDWNPAVYPGAPEICDRLDNNCDTVVDEGFGFCDVDQDGYDESVDCNDDDASINPGAQELCDWVDNDCDGIADDPDYDGDGVGNCNDFCPDDPNKGALPFGEPIYWCPCGVPEDVDSDGDGFPDCADNCPDNPNHPPDDSDGDGWDDCTDLCPNDPDRGNPTRQLACPCGVPNVDADGDFVWDCYDPCPGEVNGPDSDLDGMPDCGDLCPADPWKFAPGACGCGVVEIDDDADFVCDTADNCASVPNPLQQDLDNDGTGYACDCDPADPGVTTVIGPATGLHFTDEASLVWTAPVDGGGGTPTFDLLRSGAAWDFALPDCVATGTPATSATDPASPPSGTWFYLVRTNGACGDHLGLTSGETRRAGGACP